MKKLYEDEGKSAREVSIILGISKPTCLDWMSKLGIFIRSSGKAILLKYQKDEKYRVATSSRAKRQWQDKAFRERQAISRCYFWESNNEARLSAREKATKFWNDPIRKAEVALRAQKQWENPAYRKNMLSVLVVARGKVDKEKRISATRGALIKRWQDEDFRKKMMEVLAGFWSDPIHRQQMSIKAKERWKNADFREKHRHGLLLAILQGTMSSRVYTPQLLKMMLTWKGTGCSFPNCSILLSSKKKNKWHACRKHHNRVLSVLWNARQRRKAVLEAFGF